MISSFYRKGFHDPKRRWVLLSGDLMRYFLMAGAGFTDLVASLEIELIAQFSELDNNFILAIF